MPINGIVVDDNDDDRNSEQSTFDDDDKLFSDAESELHDDENPSPRHQTWVDSSVESALAPGSCVRSKDVARRGGKNHQVVVVPPAIAAVPPMKRIGSADTFTSIKEMLNFSSIYERNHENSSSGDDSSISSDVETFSNMPSGSQQNANWPSKRRLDPSILGIIKKSDNKYFIRGRGTRVVKARPKNIEWNDDFEKISDQEETAPCAEEVEEVLNEVLIKSDSKVHIQGRGKRVVKTTARQSNSKDDDLIDRFLQVKARTHRSGRRFSQ